MLIKTRSQGKFPFQINLPHQVVEEPSEDTQPLSSRLEAPAISDTEMSHDEVAESRSSDQDQDIEYTIESGHPDGLSFSEESSFLGEDSDDSRKQ